MKRSAKYYIAICLSLLIASIASAQDNRAKSYVGFNIGAGTSNLFLGSQDAMTTPLLGLGATAGVFYELEYKHLLFHTGFGVDYSINKNIIPIGDMSVNIAEYPTMLYHYSFDNFTEKNTYGVGYVPVMLGASFKRWYFLAGGKFGVLSFANTAQSQTDVTAWATDQDIVGTLENMPIHGLQDFHITSDIMPIKMQPFNIMLSAEIGLHLTKKAWQPEVKKKMDKAERYREAKRKKTLKERTNYKLSLFADYGLSNIHNYKPNLVPHNADEVGGLISMANAKDMKPYTVLGYQPYATSPLNNLLVGVKLTLQFEIPKKKPAKGTYPYIYVYTQNELTQQPVSGARVKMQQRGAKSIYDKYTDVKHGCVGKAFAPGQYWVHVSHANYAPLDTIPFVHVDDYDTLRVAMYPLQQKCFTVENALIHQPMHAELHLRSTDGKYDMHLSTDSLYSVCVKVDNRVQYILTTTVEGYEPYTRTLAWEDATEDITTIGLTPIPRKTFVLQNMHFATAETTILPSSQQALNSLYQLLSENNDLYIRIVGHTDDIGSEESNQTLSEGRAKSVYTEMVNRGIAPQRILTMGKGESQPVVPNTSEANRQKNRRVEIEIIAGGDNVNIERLTK